LYLLILAAPAPAATQDSRPLVYDAVPSTPARVNDLLYVQPFRLATGYRNDWSRERPIVTSGLLVVLDVDPALVVPRDAAEPILYAGDVPIQRLNHGDRSGRVIGIVPGNVNLASVPLWFGSPGLPERVAIQAARPERLRAEAQGFRPFSPAKVRGVTRGTIVAADVSALLRDVVANLVLHYSPAEKELAEMWRLPTARAPSRRPVQKR